MYILYVVHHKADSGHKTATIHTWHKSVNWRGNDDPTDCCWLVPGTVNPED